MELHELRQLIAKYNAGEATVEEQVFIEQWYESIQGSDTTLNEAALGSIRNQMETTLTAYTHKKKVSIYTRWIAAASIIVAVGAGLYLLRQQTGRPAEVVQQNDIAPGGTRAVLTLGDGKQLVLDNMNNGQLAKQNGAVISKNANGQIVYRAVAGSLPETNNTITTPRGGMYAVILTDGTKIWLNAASSLQFPTLFTGDTRTVELEGEAYFEVAQNAKAPFRVISGQQTIEVLGTHFNISHYNDEPGITTTLLEGSIRVITGDHSVVLKTGQQSVIKTGNEQITVNNEKDSSEVMAWKNGMFQFNNADISTIMRQIGRWYDVDVVFEGKLPEDQFRGKISRNVNASKVLKILELSGINFKIEGRRIILK